MWPLASLAAALWAAGSSPSAEAASARTETVLPPPELVLTRDDTEVDRSARVVIPPGTVIPDAAGDGVLRVVAGRAGLVLRASPPARSCAGRPRGRPGTRSPVRACASRGGATSS